MIEDVRPDPESEERYQRATIEMNRALADARYPLTRVTFATMYGVRARHDVVARAIARRAGRGAQRESVVEGARRGARRSLTAACDASVVHRAIEPVIVRHDLTQE